MPVPANAQPLYADMAMLLVKNETTPGTDALPTVTENAIMTKMCDIKPSIEVIDLTRYGHSFRSPGGVPGKSFMEFDMEIPLVVERVNTAHFSVPEPKFSPLLQSSGFKATAEQDLTGANDYHAAVISGEFQFYELSDGLTLDVAVDGGLAATATFNTADFVDITRATAAEVAAVISADIAGATAVAWEGRVIIYTDTLTSSGAIEVSGGTAATVFNFPTGQVDAYLITNRWVFEQQSLACAQTFTGYWYMFPACAETDDKCYLIKGYGGVANVEFILDRDAESCVKFTGKCAWGDIINTTWNDVKAQGVKYGRSVYDALIAIGGTIEFDDYVSPSTRTDVFGKMSINMNWEVKERQDQSQARGIRAFYITRQGSCTGSYDPEEWTPDIYDRWGAVFDADRQGLQMILTSPQGSQLTIEAPNVQFGSPEFNKDGIVRFDQSFYLRDDSDDGDDYLKLTFEIV